MALFYDENAAKNTAQYGVSDVETIADPHTFSTQGMEEMLPRVAHNIGVRFENASLVMGGTLDATAAWQRAAYMPEGAAITPKDYHAAIMPAIQPLRRPNPVTTSGAVNLLGGLLESTPTIAAGFVNPIAAVAMEGISSYGGAMGEAKEMGLNYDQAQQYAAVAALPNAFGAALPGWGNFGKTFLPRFVSRFFIGGTQNVAMDQVSSWGRAKILDDLGYHAQAEQQRQLDTTQELASFLMGGFMNQIPHMSVPEPVRELVNKMRNRSELTDAAMHMVQEDHFTTESAPGIPTSPEAQQAHYDAMESAAKAIDEGRSVDVSDVPGLFEHEFAMKTPEAFQQEITAIHHEDLNQQLARGEITPEQHAERWDQAPTYEGIREQVSKYEASMPGNLNDIQAAKNAAEEFDTPLAKPVDADATKPDVGDALDSDDYLVQRFQEMRTQADSLAASDPAAAAALHDIINQAEQGHTFDMQEASAYEVAAACAINYGL